MATYIKEIKKNVVLPENKTVKDFMNDYEMWNGCEDGLKNEGYSFPDSIKEKNKSIQKQEEAKKLQKKRRNNKKARKEQYNIDKYDRTKDPFYGKSMDERKQLQKEYRKYLQDQEQQKDNRMKEMMEHMSKMSESEQKEYISKLMSEMGTTPEEVEKEVKKEEELTQNETIIEEVKEKELTEKSENIIEEEKQ